MEAIVLSDTLAGAALLHIPDGCWAALDTVSWHCPPCAAEWYRKMAADNLWGQVNPHFVLRYLPPASGQRCTMCTPACVQRMEAKAWRAAIDVAAENQR